MTIKQTLYFLVILSKAKDLLTLGAYLSRHPEQSEGSPHVFNI
jgi:hypothetical protein